VLWPSEELRRLIAQTQYKDLDIDKNMTVTNGDQEANYISTMLCIDPGDEVIITAPIWPQIQYVSESIGAKIHIFNLQFEDEWAPDLDKLNNLVTRRTKLIVISFPNNPTGRVLKDSEMKAIAEIAKDAHAYLLSDETYRFLEWDGQLSPTAIDYGEHAISTSTVSKTFATVGVRIGWIACRNPAFIQRAKDLHFYTTMQNNNLGEYVATELFKRWNYFVPKNKQLGLYNLQILSDWMKDHREDISWVKPAGSTICFPRINLPMSSLEFAEGLLTFQKAVIAPGSAWGREYDKFFRLGFAKKTEVLKAGLQRLDNYLKLAKSPEPKQTPEQKIQGKVGIGVWDS
jgi:aspartate/methionine/tyrosine aminotransferase